MKIIINKRDLITRINENYDHSSQSFKRIIFWWIGLSWMIEFYPNNQEIFR